MVRGAVELEHTERGLLPHRLPARARAQYHDDRLAAAETQPAGVRVVFRTSATSVELDVIATKQVYPGAPPRPDGVYDLVVDGRLVGQASAESGDVVTIDMATGHGDRTEGAPETLRFDGLPGEDKEVQIWLPHNERTELVGLRADAPIAQALESGRPRWLHHGSSISQGSNAVSPTGTWLVTAAMEGAVDPVNLGFSGSALLDPFVARAMRDIPADVVSVAIGINVVNADLMRRRAFGPAVHGFLDTLRDGHPDTPLLIVSPIQCPIHEDTPGPGAFDLDALRAGTVRFRATGDPDEIRDGKLTLSIVRDELASIVAQRAVDDPRLFHLDGRELYGESDYARLPLPDELHPDAETHRLMGERFARLVFDDNGPLAMRAGRPGR
ncbi:SGNH/GDSL hydrolase family protein [Rhodococcus sp. HNM0569]|uniref:SGNH/GDSL hydrolase family protein n=1 Tax=Rhodococcus sp. HNM0569 TaxID=2716340 RepID=UPI001F0E8C9E|nr:SGNH/GDSL hydrolase family protein [Rhodococcus sp. HNM0569]